MILEQHANFSYDFGEIFIHELYNMRNRCLKSQTIDLNRIYILTTNMNKPLQAIYPFLKQTKVFELWLESKLYISAHFRQKVIGVNK